MSGTVDVTRCRDLDPAVLDLWSTLLEPDGQFASPFFHPSYHLMLDLAGVARIEVAIVSGEHGRPEAFWPFQRRDRHRGIPPGGRLTDYQGMIGATEVAAAELLRAARLDEWRFDHVPAEDGVFAPEATSSEPSPRIDLRGGSEWVESRRFASNLDSKRRRLERTHGETTYEVASQNERDLVAMMRWKSAQYLRSGKIDLFADDAVRDFSLRLVQDRSDGFVGRLSVLRAGNRPIAAHLGMLAAGVWHYWIPAYDPGFGAFSPGSLLLREMCRSARDESLVIDLGRGEQPYKTALANDHRIVTQGIALRSGIGARSRRFARHGAQRIVRPLRHR